MPALAVFSATLKLVLSFAPAVRPPTVPLAYESAMLPWLIPHYARYTLWIYFMLLVLWPVLAGAALHSTISRSPTFFFAIVVVTIIVLIAVLTLAGNAVGLMIMVAASDACVETQITSGSEVGYTCPTQYLGTIELESRRGLPIMWLVDQSY